MKLLHAADFHLDSPFRQLTAEQAMVRRRELRELPVRLAALVREEGAELVLLPGDLFDGERVYPETIAALAGALEAMAVPVFVAPGNHDYYHPGSPYATADWPDNVHIFAGPELQTVELPELNCAVHGCAFTDAHREDDPLRGFAAPDDGRLHLLCVHGEVGLAGRYGPIDPKSLERCGADYAALGHVHACSGLQRAGEVCWAYPGCPEGRGFDELGPKGALSVTVERGRAEARFLPLCRRQYRIEPVAAEDFAAALPQGESPDLVRFLLTGESSTVPDLAALAALAAPHFFHVELRDATTLPADLWAQGSEDTLTGLFLREMRRRLDEAEEAERDKLLLAARFGLAALRGEEDVRP